jgi:hypothetical protein
MDQAEQAAVASSSLKDMRKSLEATDLLPRDYTAIQLSRKRILSVARSQAIEGSVAFCSTGSMFRTISLVGSAKTCFPIVTLR